MRIKIRANLLRSGTNTIIHKTLERNQDKGEAPFILVSKVIIKRLQTMIEKNNGDKLIKLSFNQAKSENANWLGGEYDELTRVFLEFLFTLWNGDYKNDICIA